MVLLFILTLILIVPVSALSAGNKIHLNKVMIILVPVTILWCKPEYPTLTLATMSFKVLSDVVKSSQY